MGRGESNPTESAQLVRWWSGLRLAGIMTVEPFDEAVLGSHLRPRPLPLCPELSLWLLGDEVDLSTRVSELFSIDTAPYWAFCWGSGQALARYVLDHPELVRGRTVVDFGAGSGVSGIAAALAGARDVLAVDMDPLALRAVDENARLNGVSVRTGRALPEQLDVLLASDVLYELGNRDLLLDHARRGRTVIASDPLRMGNPRLPFSPSHTYEVETMPNVDAPLKSAVVYLLPMNE
jgi:predicted nicotinamide N-methyase